MAKQQLTRDELINKRMRAARFQDDIRLYSVDLQENKEALDAAMGFIAALQDLINWCNMKIGEQIKS